MMTSPNPMPTEGEVLSPTLGEKKAVSDNQRLFEQETPMGEFSVKSQICRGMKEQHIDEPENTKDKVPSDIKEKLRVCHVHPRRDKSQTSRAVTWTGSQSVTVAEVGVPLITEPGDAIVRITTSAICGSDLHMYANEVPGVNTMQKGDVLGHEAVGVVQEVGTEVKNFKKGDRVVIASVISCGQCEYCLKGQMSLCDCTNPSQEMQELYGHRLAGIFGYTHLTGGYDGLQAEHARVPLADVNLLKLPDDVADESAVFLSDVCCTAWHGLELCEADKNTKSLAIWGAGPIGLMTVHLAKYRGVSRIVIMDKNEERLARARFAGAETINFEKEDCVKKLQSMFPQGVEKCIDCVGYRFPKSLMHRFSRTLKLETDSPEVIDEIVRVCKKGGHISLIGDYFGMANNFPIGTMMEKGFTIRGGQLFVHKYWGHLLELIQKKAIDPTFIVSHRLDFATNAVDAYRIFFKREDGAIKILLKTKFYDEELGRKAALSFVPKSSWSSNK